MGIVYLGRDPVIGRMVALKTIRLVSEDEIEQREFGERFLREAQAAGILSHPNIVTVHDVGEDSETKTSFIAMEYVEGKNLKQLLAERTVFTYERVAEMIGQVAEALDYAHRRGIVHRDVKPANVMITPDGVVKITDFGIAKMEQSTLTSTGQFLGTPNYMSPEQVTGDTVDGRSDLFSLGVVLYELLTRKKPFSADNLTSISYKIVHEAFVPPETFDAAIPPEFTPILLKALSKDAGQRFQRGNDFALALYEFKAREEERQMLRDLGQMVAEAEKLGPVAAVTAPTPIFPREAPPTEAPLTPPAPAAAPPAPDAVAALSGTPPAVGQLSSPLDTLKAIPAGGPPKELTEPVQRPIAAPVRKPVDEWVLDEPAPKPKKGKEPVPAAPSVDVSSPGTELPPEPAQPAPPSPSAPELAHLPTEILMAPIPFRPGKAPATTPAAGLPLPLPPAPAAPPSSPSPTPPAAADAAEMKTERISLTEMPMPAIHPRSSGVAIPPVVTTPSPVPAAAPVPPSPPMAPLPMPGPSAADLAAIDRPTEILRDAMDMVRTGALAAGAIPPPPAKVVPHPPAPARPPSPPARPAPPPTPAAGLSAPRPKAPPPAPSKGVSHVPPARPSTGSGLASAPKSPPVSTPAPPAKVAPPPAAQPAVDTAPPLPIPVPEPPPALAAEAPAVKVPTAPSGSVWKRPVNLSFIVLTLGLLLVAVVAVVGVLLSKKAALRPVAPVDVSLENEVRERSRLMKDANRLVAEGKLDEALAKFRELVRRAPDSGAAREAIVRIEGQLKVRQEGESQTRELEARLQAARDALAAGDDSRALAAADAVFALVPDQSEAVQIRDTARTHLTEKAAAEQKKALEEKAKKRKPTPVPTPAPKPVVSRPVEAPAAPTPTPSSARVRISFQCPFREGYVMVRHNDKEVFRKAVDFGKKSQGGLVEGTVEVPAGPGEFKVWAIASDRSVNAYQPYKATVPGGETRTLVLEVAGGSSLSVSLR